jgi:hypothetical protein
MPIPNSFTTLTGYILIIIAFPFGCLVDDRVIGDYSFAFRACNLVAHFLSSFDSVLYNLAGVIVSNGFGA